MCPSGQNRGSRRLKRGKRRSGFTFGRATAGQRCYRCKEAGPYRYVILDRDSKFNGEVIAFLEATGLKPRRTSVQAPWQNGLAERWIGSCRRELLDHVIALNESHLRRLIREYVAYHHEDRIHDSLEKDTPNRRPIDCRRSTAAEVVSSARLGGLHHRYSWREAA
jgi:putative transposase